MCLVGADGVVTRPFAIVETLAQRKCSFMKWSADRHAVLSERAIISILRTREQDSSPHIPRLGDSRKGSYVSINQRKTIWSCHYCCRAVPEFGRRCARSVKER